MGWNDVGTMLQRETYLSLKVRAGSCFARAALGCLRWRAYALQEYVAMWSLQTASHDRKPNGSLPASDCGVNSHQHEPGNVQQLLEMVTLAIRGTSRTAGKLPRLCLLCLQCRAQRGFSKISAAELHTEALGLPSASCSSSVSGYPH